MLVEAVHLPGLEVLLRPLQRIIVDTSLPPDFNAPESWDVPSHLPILEAIEARDPAAAVEAMRSHYALFDGPNYTDMLSRRVRDMPRALGADRPRLTLSLRRISALSAEKEGFEPSTEVNPL